MTPNKPIKSISTPAIVALLSAAIAFGAVAPVLAQTELAQTEAAAPAPVQNQSQAEPESPAGKSFAHRGHRENRGAPHHAGPLDGMGGVLALERGAQAVEIALVRLSHRIDLTEEQQALFDTLKTDALAAAEALAPALAALRPALPNEGESAGAEAPAPDFSQKLEQRIAFETAQLAALTAVEPAATAFFDSLSTTQIAQLTPETGPGRAGGPDHDGPNHGGPRSH